MAHSYEQRSGRWQHEGELLGVGYSGLDDGDGIAEPGEGQNDPSKQAVRNIGPIPAGAYWIGEPFTHATAGQLTMRLEPMPGTETFGRSGFLIHGDSKKKGTASHGCIVLPRAVRLRIAVSPDRQLLVVADAPPAPVV
jgi:hypothetical protein